MTVPDALPVISRGSHTRPTEGACIMEYISIIAGLPFTDHPACTHPALAAMARSVNDALRDDERYRLVPLIGRLFGTGCTWDAAQDGSVSAALARWCRAISGRCPCSHRPPGGDAVEAASIAVSCARDSGPQVLVSLLSDFIDEYDRLTGRGSQPDRTEQFREAAGKVGASA